MRVREGGPMSKGGWSADLAHPPARAARPELDPPSARTWPTNTNEGSGPANRSEGSANRSEGLAQARLAWALSIKVKADRRHVVE